MHTTSKALVRTVLSSERARHVIPFPERRTFAKHVDAILELKRQHNAVRSDSDR